MYAEDTVSGRYASLQLNNYHGPQIRISCNNVNLVLPLKKAYYWPKKLFFFNEKLRDEFGEYELLRWRTMAQSEEQILVDYFVRNYEQEDIIVFEQHFM